MPTTTAHPRAREQREESISFLRTVNNGNGLWFLVKKRWWLCSKSSCAPPANTTRVSGLARATKTPTCVAFHILARRIAVGLCVCVFYVFACVLYTTFTRLRLRAMRFLRCTAAQTVTSCVYNTRGGLRSWSVFVVCNIILHLCVAILGVSNLAISARNPLCAL